MVYYGLLGLAVVMFAFQFLFNGIFEKEYGNGMRALLVFSAGSSATGLLALLVINGFKFEFTPFSLGIAVLAAIDFMGYSFFSLKSLGRINLSLYSVFAMLGGMALPFLTGIIFYNEELTAIKLISFALIVLSLFLTVEKDGNKSGYKYYAGVFILNGLSGVISTIFQKAPFEKTSEAGFSVLTVLVILVISLIFLPLTKTQGKKLTLKAAVSMSVYGIISRVANFFLLLSLAHIPASAQYPFVTGGVMAVSTVICCFTDNKPKKRELIAVAVSFAALVILMIGTV